MPFKKTPTVLLFVCFAVVDVWPLKIITPVRKMHPQVTVAVGLFGSLMAFVSPWCYIWSAAVFAYLCAVTSLHNGVSQHAKKMQSQMLPPACLNLLWICVVWILSAPHLLSPRLLSSRLPDDRYAAKYLATMTWKSAHLTLSMSLTLHSPSRQRDIMLFFK